MIKKDKPTKFTQAMRDQLVAYCDDQRIDGSYWGNKEQFYDRHDKIVNWILEQKIYNK